MKESTFNRWFNILIVAGMVVATVLITLFEWGKSPDGNLLLLVAGIGSIMGVLCTVFSANGHILTFLFGFFDVAIYAVMCFIGARYGNAALYTLFFLPMQFVGFAQWRRRGADAQTQVRARRFKGRQWLLYSMLFLVGSVVAYLILARFDKSAADSFIKVAVLCDAVSMICNLLGQVLMTFAYMEQWIFWIAVNVFTIVMWVASLDEPADSYALVLVVKYVFYLLNSINGLRVWLNLSGNNADL